MDLTGIHHLTAVSANISGNYRFYTEVMGMRLVKRSVNQDDVSAYHLFYADAVGSPGTDLTFFDWAMPRERRGTNSLSQTYLRVSGASLRWWEQWLREKGVSIVGDGTIERDGRLTLDFEDPEGQRLALVDDGGQGGDGKPWAESPVPAEHQVRGLGPIQMSVSDLAPTDRVLTQVMNMRRVREYDHPADERHKVVVYAMSEGGPHQVSVQFVPRWFSEIFGFDFVVHDATLDVSPEDNPTNEPRPDLSVLLRPFWEFVSVPRQSRDLLLAVEVSVSSLYFDLKTKAPLYARAGIPEYWVLDVEQRRLFVHRLPEGGAYTSITVFAEPESIAPLAAPDKEFAVADAFPRFK